MKKVIYLMTILGFVVVAIVVLSSPSGKSVLVPRVLAQNSGCSVSTLSGSYAALYQGFINNAPAASPSQPGGGYQPQAAVIVVRFNGAGGILSSSGNVLNVGTEERSFDVIGGQYSLNSDCIGELTFLGSDGIPFRHKIHVAGSGEEYRFLRLQNPAVGIIQSGTARRMDLVQ